MTSGSSLAPPVTEGSAARGAVSNKQQRCAAGDAELAWQSKNAKKCRIACALEAVARNAYACGIPASGPPPRTAPGCAGRSASRVAERLAGSDSVAHDSAAGMSHRLPE